MLAALNQLKDIAQQDDQIAYFQELDEAERMLEEQKREKDTLWLGADEIPDDLGHFGQKLSKYYHNNADDDAMMDYFLQEKFTPCTYFSSGNCKYGDKCKYLHDEKLVKG